MHPYCVVSEGACMECLGMFNAKGYRQGPIKYASVVGRFQIILPIVGMCCIVSKLRSM